MKHRLTVFAVVLLLGSAHLPAEEQVRSVQEELRRRNVYFGDVDGRRTPELQEAVRIYQRRKGFVATGAEDRDTLRSLGLAERSPDEPPPRELSWPEEPVLKSDVSINLVQAAQEYSQESGVAPVVVGAPQQVSRTRSILTPAAATLQKPTAPKRISTRGRLPAVGSREGPAIEERELVRFVKDFFKAMGKNDLRNELQFYADRLDYYGNGQIDRRLVEHTLRRYYQRWPNRSYKVGDALDYQIIPSRGEIVATFPVQFSFKRGRQKVRGATTNRFVINAATADPRIVSIEERRVRR